jgi:hypothetical protein
VGRSWTVTRSAIDIPLLDVAVVRRCVAPLDRPYTEPAHSRSSTSFVARINLCPAIEAFSGMSWAATAGM